MSSTLINGNDESIIVPIIDTTKNNTIRDVVGNKSDTSAGTSLIGISKAIKAKTDIVVTTTTFAVPTKNTTDNVDIADVIGNKTDDEDGTSVMSRLYKLERHIHAVAQVYPLRANPVTLAKDAGVWADFPAAKTEIIPAGTTTTPIDIHYVSATNLSANGNYVIALYEGGAGTEALIGYAVAVRTAVGGTEAAAPIMTPIIAAGTRISAALTSSNNAADTLQIKVHYHEY